MPETTSTLSVLFQISCLASNTVDMKLGGAICGSFVFFGGLSVLLYKPWRRRIDRKRESCLQQEHSQEDVALGELPEFRASPDFDRSQGDRAIPITASNVKANPNDLEAIPTFSSCHDPSRFADIEWKREQTL